MKKIVVLLFILLAFYSCETVEELPEEISFEEGLLLVEQDIAYTQGEWRANEFSSEWFGFRYAPTQGMFLTSETDLQEINAIQSMNFDGPEAELVDYTKMQIAYEVLAKSGDGETRLEVLSEKIFADDLTVEQYIEILKMELALTHGRDVVFNEYAAILLGNSYYLELTATINIEGVTVYQTVFLSQRGDRFATVVLDYKDPLKLEELLLGFTPY